MLPAPKMARTGLGGRCLQLERTTGREWSPLELKASLGAERRRGNSRHIRYLAVVWSYSFCPAVRVCVNRTLEEERRLARSLQSQTPSSSDREEVVAGRRAWSPQLLLAVLAWPVWGVSPATRLRSGVSDITKAVLASLTVSSFAHLPPDCRVNWVYWYSTPALSVYAGNPAIICSLGP